MCSKISNERNINPYKTHALSRKRGRLGGGEKNGFYVFKELPIHIKLLRILSTSVTLKTATF